MNEKLAEGIGDIVTSTFVDIGAGNGVYVRHLREMGFVGYGIEKKSGVFERSGTLVVDADVREPLDSLLCPAADVAFSISLPMLRAHRNEQVINNVCSLALRILIIGWHTRDQSELVQEIQRRGFDVDHPKTKSLRDYCNGWKTTLWVFRRVRCSDG